jgi:small subunit ribosomal protein S3
MSQKINPIGFRVGRTINWKSRWFAGNNNYKDFLLEDIKLRKEIMKKLVPAGVTEVEIERLPKSLSISVTVSRPGVVIGRGGTGIEELKNFVTFLLKGSNVTNISQVKIDLKVKELKNPEMSAHLVAEKIALDLERRIPHRRVVMKAMERVMTSGAEGIKIVLSGRINGAEISRVEKFKQGSVSTQTLREIIDYGQRPALTKRGYVGVKVWIHKREED